jgi:hypothetical protein
VPAQARQAAEAGVARQEGEPAPNLGVSEVSRAEYDITGSRRIRGYCVLRLDHLISYDGMDDQAGKEFGVEKG